MAKIISKKEVQQIAHLARIHLAEQELDRLAKDLEDILHYVNKLARLDVSRVEPTSHVLPLKNVYRNDDVKASLPQNEALSIAIEKQDGLFKVPQIID